MYGVVAVGETVTLDPVPPVDHAYVPPAGDPVATSVAGAPAQIVWFVLANVGITLTVIKFVWVEVLDPLALVAVNATVYVPAVLKVTTGLVAVEVEGVPPPKVQL